MSSTPKCKRVRKAKMEGEQPEDFRKRRDKEIYHSNQCSAKYNVSTCDRKPDETQQDYKKRKALERYYFKVKPEKDEERKKEFYKLMRMGTQPVATRSSLTYWRKKYATDSQAMEILNDKTTSTAERLLRIKDYQYHLKIHHG